MATVTLRGVSKTYQGSHANNPVAAVKQVDLAVGDGEFVVLVGPSGCGKTTTLRMIAGLEDASAGEILIGPQLVNRVPPKDRNIAMVFQNYALYPHMNVYRNMAFGLELRYRSDWGSRLWLAVTQPKAAVDLAELRSGIRPRVEQTAEMLGIKHLLDRKPGQLSGGEKQRVALGRAIVRQPAAFLFDEPLSNLDAQLRGEMRRELKRLHQELRATMIYVTHDQVEAMTLGDRIVVMNRGEVRQVGTPLEVYDHPQDRFVARFLGSPPMNFIPGELRQGPGGWTFHNSAVGLEVKGLEDCVNGVDLIAGRKLLAGIRPEHVGLSPAAESGQAKVELIEPLGDSTLVHVKWQGAEPIQLSAKMQNRSLREGAGVLPQFETKHIHWFDAETEKRLASAEKHSGAQT